MRFEGISHQAGYPAAVSPLESNYAAERVEARRSLGGVVLGQQVGWAARETAGWYKNLATGDTTGPVPIPTQIAINGMRTRLVGMAKNAVEKDSIASLSDSELAGLVVNKIDSLPLEEKQYESRVDIFKADLADSLDMLSVSGIPINTKRARERLASARFGLKDPALTETPGLFKGLYDPDLDIVFLGPEVFDETFFPEVGKKTVFHELLHATAGLLVNREFEGAVPERLRSGLRGRLGVAPEQDKTHKFAWLDEAVTDQLATYLSMMPTSNNGNVLPLTAAAFFDRSILEDDKGLFSGYKAERMALSKIVLGAPNPDELLRVILGAYFEDYEPGGYGDDASRQPLRKDMFHTMSQYLDLARLDTTYHEQGAAGFSKELQKQTAANDGRIRNLTRLTRADIQRRRQILRRRPRENTKRIIAEHRTRRAA